MARWSYTTQLPCKKLQGVDEWGNETYGAEFSIDCTFAATVEMARDANGQEFVARHNVFTEDFSLVVGDMIGIAGEWQKIRSVQAWDMSQFGAADQPLDYKLVT